MKTRSTAALALLAGAAIGVVAVQGLHAQTKAPVYVVTETDISDLDAFQKEYLPVVQPTIQAAGGRRVAAGQNIVVLDGPSPGTRVAINEFDSLEQAQAFYKSAAWKDLTPKREKALKVLRQFIVEAAN